MKKICVIFTLLLLVFAYIHLVFLGSGEEFVENDLYDEILQRGKIKIGVNSNSKPFGFKNEKGELVGYDVDLAKHITQYLLKDSSKLELVPLNSDERLIKASTGEVDIVIATLTITPSRQEIISFSHPYDIAGQAILVKSNSSIRSLTDLGGQNVGVIFGTTAEKNMTKLIPTANLRGYKTYEDAYNALKAGHINAITSDDTLLSGFAMGDSSVKLLPKRYSKEPYGIAFRKGDSTIKLKENLDFAIKDLQQKNIFPRLRKKWNIGI